MPARQHTGRPQHALTGSVLSRSVQVMTRGIAAEPRTYTLAIGLSAVFGAATVSFLVYPAGTFVRFDHTITAE